MKQVRQTFLPGSLYFIKYPEPPMRSINWISVNSCKHESEIVTTLFEMTPQWPTGNYLWWCAATSSDQKHSFFSCHRSTEGLLKRCSVCGFLYFRTVNIISVHIEGDIYSMSMQIHVYIWSYSCLDATGTTTKRQLWSLAGCLVLPLIMLSWGGAT